MIVYRLLPALALATALVAARCPAGEADPAKLKAEVEETIDQAQTWLLAQQQPDGGFMKGDKYTVGITALAVDALCAQPHGLTGDDPRIMKALKLLASCQQADGGIYKKDEGLGNYGTSISLIALVSAGKDQDPAFVDVVKKAQKFLFSCQSTEAGVNEGAMGYDDDIKGEHDLGNTGPAVEALRKTGIPASDPRMLKALEFIQRCQNLSLVNKMPGGNNDGGGYYSPKESKANGSSATEPEQANPTPHLTSYGSMTYLLISTYVMLDLKADDPRVAAALNWCRNNYKLDANPGMPAGSEKQGLFYYYTVMAKTFDLLGTKELVVKGGRKADWRADLFHAIKAAANPVMVDDKPTMIWINSADRWAEGLPHVTSTYMIRALKRIDKGL